MRTTLKRGIGRGASVNGNGRAILPPGPYTPVRRYRVEPPRHPGWRAAGRVATWIVGTIVLLAGAFAGGAYLWAQHTAAEVAPKTKQDKKATKQLAAAVDPSKPAIALVIGYDRRYGEAGHSRSDTIMLVRTQPNPKAVSILSFPRDLEVNIQCPGQTPSLNKINAAYSFCGSPGAMSTIRSITGLPINYLVTVNFRGFTQVVDRLGGIWIDVDRRYFHSNANTSPGSIDRYSEINLRPGYQKLNGAQALSFVRYRHTDDDTYRNARQQLFLKAVRQQVAKVGLTDIPRVLHAIVSNLVIGRKGGGAPTFQTMINYAQYLYGLPKGNVFQVKLNGIANTYDSSLGDIVVAQPGAIAAAVRDFVHPDVAAPIKSGSVALHTRLGKKSAAPSPSQTTVSVLNANGVAGSATLAVNGLDHIGYKILYPPNHVPDDAPPKTCVRQYCFTTQIFWNPAKKRSKAAAQKVAALFGNADVHTLPPVLKPYTNGSMVIVAVGQNFHGALAPAPVDKRPPKQPPAVTSDAAATRSLLLKAQRKVPFKLEVPTVIAQNSAVDNGPGAMPIRTYYIDGGKKALRLTFDFQNGGYTEYWGVEETNWTDAPVLGDANFEHTIKGRHYRFYFNGADLHMIALYENGATYWVVNTLLDSLSPQTMVAIAKGLEPLGAVKK